MKRFLKYVLDFDPLFSSKIQGATPMQVNMLEQLVGRTLPATYRAFLELMGNDDGGLNITIDGTARISDIMDFYRCEVGPDEFIPPSEIIVIGVGAISLPLIGLQDQRDQEPRVVFISSNEVDGLYAGSIEKLLCQLAFGHYRMSAGIRAFYTSSYSSVGRKQVLGQARKLAEALGFSGHDFSDDVCFCGEQQAMAINISQYEQHGLALSIVAERREDAERLGAAFVENFNLSQD